MISSAYTPLLPSDPVPRDMRLVTADGISVEKLAGEDWLRVEPEVLTTLSDLAFREVSHFLRSDHLTRLRTILDDPESSDNDRFVALDLLRNAEVASHGALPMCQDTGTALIMGSRGHRVITDGDDARHLSDGVFTAYRDLNLRYSQLAPLTMWDEVNTGNNLPAQIEINATKGLAYELLFLAKGGGSANKSFLFQETKALLREDRLMDFLREKLISLGTAACPPYHLAIVVGGTSAEFALKTAKLASAHHLDGLPSAGSELGHGFRDHDMERAVFEMTQELGYGAQFGGKYFCHDVRVVRLPRHNGSLPVALAVSCSADRQITAKITEEGAFMEVLDHNPGDYLPENAENSLDQGVTTIDLDQPMSYIRSQLAACPVGTRVSLSGTMIVARDIAHAKFAELLEAGQPLPQYLLNHPVYYAGPAKTPDGMVSGSFGPTTAGRMDAYVERLQAAGGSLVMLAKGNRSAQVTDSCERHGGFYLGSVGGPAARLAQDCITSTEVIDFPELGMEAVHRITVQNFPAFVVVDDKGHDFFTHTTQRSLPLIVRQ